MGSEFDEDIDGEEEEEADDDLDEESESASRLLSPRKLAPTVESLPDLRKTSEAELEPLDKLIMAQDKLGPVWSTGMMQVHIYRDYPSSDEKGNHISGKVATLNHRMESDWFEKNVGGGTFHVKFHGPSANSKGRPVLAAVYNIVIAGKPFIENKYPPDSAEAEDKKGDPSQDAMTRLLRMQDDQARRQEKRMEEMQAQIRKETELTRMKAEKESVSALQTFRDLMEAQKQAARETEEKYASILDKVFAGANDPGKEAAIRAQIEAANQAMRHAAESHAQALRDLAERHREEVSRVREDYLNQMNVMRTESSNYSRELRDSADKRERSLRDEFDRRERDAREAATLREQTIRDDFERRIENLRELSARDEKTLREQVAELKEELRATRDARERAEQKAAEAKYDMIRAEMSASKAAENPGGMLGLAKSMEEFQAVASLMGLSKGGEEATPDVFAQVATILNTEPAKRVGAGIAGLLQGLGQRGAAGAQMAAQMAPYTPPPDSALMAWNATQAQMRATEGEGQVVRRMRRRPPEQAVANAATIAQQSPGPVVQSSIPGSVVDGIVSAPETDAERQQREAVEAQAMLEAQMAQAPEPTEGEMAQSAATLLDLLEAAVNAGKSPEAVLEEVTPFLGGEAAMRIILATPEADLFGRVEAALASSNRRLSISHKQFLRKVLEAGKRKFRD